MPTPPRPTDVELKLLRALWELGSGTVKDVQAVLNRTEDYGYTAVLRMLQVLFEKGFVSRDESERSHVYTAVHPRAAMEKGLVVDLAERLFGGSAAELALAALKSGKVSAADKAKIRDLLEGKK